MGWIPNRPGNLSKATTKEWDRLAKILNQKGGLTKVDGAVMAAYCQASGRWVEQSSERRRLC